MKFCFVPLCPTKIHRGMLMCPHHWRMVPLEIRFEVYRTLRRINQGGPSRPYVLAIHRARRAVVAQEAPHLLAMIDAETADLGQEEASHA